MYTEKSFSHHISRLISGYLHWKFKKLAMISSPFYKKWGGLNLGICFFKEWQKEEIFGSQDKGHYMTQKPETRHYFWVEIPQNYKQQFAASLIPPQKKKQYVPFTPG